MTAWEKRLTLILVAGALLLATNAWLVMNDHWSAGTGRIESRQQVDVESLTIGTPGPDGHHQALG